MRTTDEIERHASELLRAAQRFQSAAQEQGCHQAAPDALASLEEALQVLSAAWYQLAADAVPATGPAGPLRDVAGAFARCARMCRRGRSIIAPAESVA
jgi:hypothetical protein